MVYDLSPMVGHSDSNCSFTIHKQSTIMVRSQLLITILWYNARTSTTWNAGTSTSENRKKKFSTCTKWWCFWWVCSGFFCTMTVNCDQVVCNGLGYLFRLTPGLTLQWYFSNCTRKKEGGGKERNESPHVYWMVKTQWEHDGSVWCMNAMKNCGKCSNLTLSLITGQSKILRILRKCKLSKLYFNCIFLQ